MMCANGYFTILRDIMDIITLHRSRTLVLETKRWLSWHK